MQYIVAAANLYGHIYGITGTRDIDAIRETLEDIVMPSFVPQMNDDEADLEADVEAGISDAGEFWGSLFLRACPARLGGGGPNLVSPLRMGVFLRCWNRPRNYAIMSA